MNWTIKITFNLSLIKAYISNNIHYFKSNAPIINFATKQSDDSLNFYSKKLTIHRWKIYCCKKFQDYSKIIEFINKKN